MGKNIVVCSDGTGNTSSRSISNVFGVVALAALEDPQRQVVVYDEGIGTPRAGLRAARALMQTREASALRVLPGPLPLGPVNLALRPLESAFGIGLRRNVRQLYQELGELYDEGDLVYLFGFSRGAFTVRALAGLIHRCGLPPRRAARSHSRFREAWNLYRPIQCDWDTVDEWRAERDQRSCPIHFLGIWDTVKSYGGLRPVLLPHLRHNPIVTTVRHAIALDEKRGWFNATTWGRLDLDRENAMTRLRAWEAAAIEKQDILEVWFRGCHSDVGGGNDKAKVTPRIALQWLLCEAFHCGLRLNAEGRRLLAAPIPGTPPDIYESLSRAWCLVDLIPRLEIDNSGKWPRRVPQKARTYHALRHPEWFLRDDRVLLHETVTDSVAHLAGPPVRTRRVGAEARSESGEVRLG